MVNLLKPMWPNGPNAEPADPTHFGVRIMLWIGSDQGASDSFNCLACSPSWLAEQFPEGDKSQLAGISHLDLASSNGVDLLVGSGLVLMRKWSLDALRQAVERICDQCAGPDWDETASRLGRYFPWEFDYLRDQYVDEHPERISHSSIWRPPDPRQCKRRRPHRHSAASLPTAICGRRRRPGPGRHPDSPVSLACHNEATGQQTSGSNRRTPRMDDLDVVVEHELPRMRP